MDKYKEAIERLKQWDKEHPNGGYAIQERDGSGSVLESLYNDLKKLKA